MLTYIWPAILIVISNVVYNITTKSTPENANPFLSLTITYLVGSCFSFIAYLLWHENNLIENIKHLNYTSILLGFAIVGLETGYIYLYRAGWKISIGSLMVNIALAVVLVIVGILFYKEHITYKQIIGVLLCVTGLIFLNVKS
ncbi:MAG: EamA family transporter [Clostridia bacterium]|nr:EamA family transporter [Clostridia bacterium]MDR3643889.1 EamA family transporter [Clostridia bacterium]